MTVVEAVGRLIPGVLGNPESLDEESFADGMLEYPQYTRPEEFRGMRVPEILLSGDHGKIREWRAAESKQRTARRRPDLAARRKF
jgi:tRNA (guanine37-N1)-methyltransferase